MSRNELNIKKKGQATNSQEAMNSLKVNCIFFSYFDLKIYTLYV